MADISSLADYLAAVRFKRWQPGVLDCGVFMADWLVLMGGRDPIADIRGAYSTEQQYRRIIRREGGFELSCASRLVPAGCVETVSPRPGDLMAVLAPYAVRRGKIQVRATGAICVSPILRAVITSDIGIVFAGQDRLPMLKAWTFNG